MIVQVRRVVAHPFISLISANFLRMVCVLLINKIASVRLSAPDFGLFGQFIAVVAVANMVSTAGLTNAVIRDVSIASEESRQLSLEYFWLTLYVSVIAGVLLAIFAPVVATRVFGSQVPIGLLLSIALALPLLGLMNFFISFFSGIGYQTLNGRIQAIGAVVGIAVFTLLTWHANTLVTFSLSYLIFLVISVVAFFIRSPLQIRWLRPTLVSVRGKLADSATMFAAILFLPTALVILRGNMAHLSGWETVATWQVLTRLSDSYIQLFAIYYSHIFFKELAKSSDRAKMMAKYGIINLLVMLSIGVVLYLGFDFIINLLFAPQYESARQFLPYQIAIDSTKVMTLVIMYYFLARRMFKQYIATEVMQTILLVILQMTPLMNRGLDGLYAILLICQFFGFVVALTFVLQRRQQL